MSTPKKDVATADDSSSPNEPKQPQHELCDRELVDRGDDRCDPIDIVRWLRDDIARIERRRRGPR